MGARFATYLAVAALCVTAEANQGGGHRRGGAAALCAPRADNYSGCDHFENFDASGTPSGWTSWFGTPNYDYTTSPIRGAQSMEADGLEGGEWEAVSGADQTYYFGFTLRAVTSASSGDPLAHGHVSGTDSLPEMKLTFCTGVTCRLQISCGNATETVNTFDFSTARRVYFKFNAATGRCAAWVDNGTGWEMSLVETAANASGEVDVTGFTLRPTNGTNAIVFDDVWIDSAPPEA